MLNLKQSVNCWPSEEFQRILKKEVESLQCGSLPLEKGLSQGGMVDDSNITATILSVNDSGSKIKTKLGIFFTEIVICCGCGDDPMPVNAYCELVGVLDKKTADVVFHSCEGS